MRRFLRGGAAAEQRRATAKRAEKLDGFKDYIIARMYVTSPARIPAAVLFREIKEQAETRVKQFVRTLIPEPILNRSSGSRRSRVSRCRRTGATVGCGADRLSVFRRRRQRCRPMLSARALDV